MIHTPNKMDNIILILFFIYLIISSWLISRELRAYFNAVYEEPRLKLRLKHEIKKSYFYSKYVTAPNGIVIYTCSVFASIMIFIAGCLLFNVDPFELILGHCMQ